MKRGRKPNSKESIVDPITLAKMKIGLYLQLICSELSMVQIISSENANDLLAKIKSTRQESSKQKTRDINDRLAPSMDEIPFQIPRNWSWCRIGDIVEHNSGKTLDGGRNKGQPRDCITTSNLQWGHFELETVKQILIEDDELNRCTATTGDLMVCEGGEAGRAAIWDFNYDICFQNHIHRLRPLGNISNKFIYFYFCFLSQSGEINKYRKGMGITNLSSKSLSSIPFPLPPLFEQNNIANFLSDFQNNELKENHTYFNQDIEKKVIKLHNAQLSGNELSFEINSQLNLVKKLRQQLIQDAIQGKLVAQDPNDKPASELLEKIRFEKGQLIKEKKIKKEKELPPIKSDEFPFEIPPSWVWCRLGEIAINCDDARDPISQSERSRRAKVYDYYGASGVIDKIDGYTHDGTFLLIGEDGANLKAKSTPVAFVATGKFWVNNHAHVLKFNDDTVLAYMVHCLNAIDINPYITGGFQPKLSQGKLSLITIPLPPFQEILRIVKKLEQLHDLCTSLDVEIREGIKLNNSLLQQVLSESMQSPKDLMDENIAPLMEENRLRKKHL